MQRDYKKAIYIYEELLYENRIEKNNNKITILGYLTEGYFKIGNYEKAYEYKNKYLDCVSVLNLEDKNKELIWIYVVSSEMELKQGNIEEAKKNLYDANKLYEENKFNTYGNTDLGLEKMKIMIEYEEYGEYSKALNEYKKILENMKSKGVKSDIVIYIMEDIVNISYLNKDYETVVKYSKEIYIAGEDSNSIIDTDIIIDTMKKEMNMKNIDIQNVKLASVIIVLVFTGGILIQSKLKNKKISVLNLRLKEMSITDSLTNTYNKRHLYDIFKEFYNSKKNIAFVMIDIDYFKLYNDNYGHLNGDEVLIRIANIMKNVFNNDLIFRYGGEEFSIISDRSKESIIIDMDRLKDKLHEENIVHKYSNCSDRITLSIGMEYSKVNSSEEIEKIISNADKKLYQSKNSGRNRITY